MRYKNIGHIGLKLYILVIITAVTQNHGNCEIVIAYTCIPNYKSIFLFPALLGWGAVDIC